MFHSRHREYLGARRGLYGLLLSVLSPRVDDRHFLERRGNILHVVLDAE